MIEKQIQTKIYGEDSSFKIKLYGEEDILWVKEVFTLWMNFKQALKKHGERSPNIPEAVSETIYCILTHSGRFANSKSKKLKDASFDAFNVITEETIQVKASQIEKDCTSFGPKTRWDKLVFVDFFNDGNVDGTFDIYEIPTEYLNKVIVREEGDITFEKRKAEGKRPRLSLKESVIYPNSIQPIYKNMKLW
jgi:hypothetical protein